MGIIIDRLRSILGKAQDLRPLIEPVRRVLWEANRERALRGVDYTGAPYAPLKPATLADRARKGYPAGPPLNRQGQNARVITGCVIVVEVRQGQLRYGKSFDVPWFEEHIRGNPARNLPQRDPLGWGNELELVRTMLPKHVLGRPI